MSDETTEPTSDETEEAVDALDEEPVAEAEEPAAEAEDDAEEQDEVELTDEERAELEERAARKAKADAVIAERRAQAERATGKATDDDAPKGKGGAEGKATKAGEDKGEAERTVTRRTVTSRRVTPKGGTGPAKVDPKAPPSTASKARDAKKTESVRKTSPTPVPADLPKGPSPWWVPTIMWTMLVAGGLVIMANYAMSGASNVRLVIGLALILGGIITATQYR